RAGHLAVHPRRKHSHCAAVSRERARGSDSRRLDRADSRSERTPARREGKNGEVPDAFARLRAVHRRDSFGRRHLAEDYRRDDFVQALGTRKSRHRSRRRRLDGNQEARGILLMISLTHDSRPSSFAEFLEQDLNTELLRFTTAGSVDDGKSTLIGRLLHDSKAVYEDQLASVKRSRINRSTGPVDFSLITDGLRAEREQGITIDVAYRYF